MSSANEKTSRREYLKSWAAGAAAVSAAGCRARAAKPGAAPADGVRISLGGRGPEMVARARALGYEYEEKFGNCAQCTIAALQDAVELVPANGDVFAAGTPLAGGATASGNANCGGFSGAGIVIGQLCGRTRDRFGDRRATRRAGRLLREVAARYEAAYGSVLCKDVREKAGRKCPEVVANAAGWTAEAILKEFSDYAGEEPPPAKPPA